MIQAVQCSHMEFCNCFLRELKEQWEDNSRLKKILLSLQNKKSLDIKNCPVRSFVAYEFMSSISKWFVGDWKFRLIMCCIQIPHICWKNDISTMLLSWEKPLEVIGEDYSFKDTPFFGGWFRASQEQVHWGYVFNKSTGVRSWCDQYLTIYIMEQKETMEVVSGCWWNNFQLYFNVSLDDLQVTILR